VRVWISLRSADAKRREIRVYFHATFDRYERLFEVLSGDEAYYRKPISLRHPLIFYFGHTATFFINKLVLAGLVTERLNPKFESMFAVGVDEMSWDDLNDSHYDWPAVAEVRGVSPAGARLGDGTHRHPAPGPAHRLGTSLVAHPHGHRARAHPPGNLVGADPPA
jgi:hypothetical protein